MYKRNLLLKILCSFILITIFSSPLLLTNAKTNANLVPNPSFETADTSFWNDLWGNSYRDDSTSTDGSWSLGMNSEIEWIEEVHHANLQSDAISVTAGVYFNILFSVKSDDGVTIEGYLVWDNAPSTWFCTTVSTNFGSSGGTIQVPSGCTTVKFYFYDSSVETSSFTFHIDNIQLDYPPVPEFEPTIMISILGIFTAAIILFKKRN